MSPRLVVRSEQQEQQYLAYLGASEADAICLPDGHATVPMDLNAPKGGRVLLHESVRV